MDVRVAIITGTAFAGVLVAGALAAPRGGNDSNTGDSTVVATGANGELVSLPAILSYSEDEEDDDDRYEDDDDDHDGGRKHDDDDEKDDD
jgi:hypothetical protein